jgi:hypothetical protein
MLYVDDNFDDNRADMQRYVAAQTNRFESTKYLQIRHFAGRRDTTRMMPVTDLKSGS